MIVVLNPHAGGGAAENRWRSVRDALPLRDPVRVCTLDHNVDLSDVVRHALRDGERDFIAAGGDGTVNALITALILCLHGGEDPNIRCGAVGLGSSNDFHKPLDDTRMVRGIPYKMDLADAQPRDVGVVRFQEGDTYRERFFLINASVGVTASANDFFNHPDPLLGFLKRAAPGAAILYAAVRTILCYRNRRMVVTNPGGSRMSVELTNLALVKSPHVSGGLHYDCLPGYTTGSFKVYLCSGLGIMARFGLLRRLSRGEFKEGERCHAWETSGISLHAEKTFTVEIDGEVVVTRRVSFGILPHHLRVCS